MQFDFTELAANLVTLHAIPYNVVCGQSAHGGPNDMTHPDGTLLCHTCLFEVLVL